jgi:hypothetical protein
MARKERRGAHRYPLARPEAFLGWREGTLFRTHVVSLRNLSMTGALMRVEPPCPASGTIWLAVAGRKPANWVQGEILEAITGPEGERDLRVQLRESFPYEDFKAAIWGAEASPAAPTAPDGPSDSATKLDHGAVAASSPVKAALGDAQRLRFFLGQEDEEPNRNEEEPGLRPASYSASPPCLIDAQRAHRAMEDRVSHLSWVTVLALCVSVSLLVALVVTARLHSLRDIGVMLGLAD